MTNRDSFELDGALAELEAGPAGAGLRAVAGGLEPDAAALERLERRLRLAPLKAPARRQAWPAALFGRRLPRLAAGLALVLGLAGAAALASRQAPPVSAAEVVREAGARAGVVAPGGQVRHLVRESFSSGPDGQLAYVDEIWLKEDQGRVLVWLPPRRALPGTVLPDGSQPDGGNMALPGQLIDGRHVWSIDPAANAVTKAPFDACSYDLGQWVGDPAFFAEMSGYDNLRLVGEERLDGRSTQVIDWNGARVWIDLATGQIVQFQQTYEFEGARTESRDRITVDELLDPAAVPADLFTFAPPPGATIEERAEPLCSNG